MKIFLQLTLSITLLLITTSGIFCQQNTNIRYSQSGNKTQILFNTDNLKFDDVIINNELFKSLVYNNTSKILLKGAPEVLKLATALQIPEGKSIEINVANSEYFEINDINLAPSKGTILRDQNPKNIKYTFGEEYSKNEFFPGKLFQSNNPYTFRDVKGQSIWIYPFQYNPITKTLRVYKKLTLDITYKNNRESKDLIKRTKKSKLQVFENIYARNFINYSASRYSPVKEEGKMIVIAHPDFATEMENFVNWKNQKGQETELFAFNHAEINSDKDKLKTFIAKKYQDENIAFVLLVGDSQHIPPLYKSGDSDAAYGHIDGSDSYPEVIIGRFSAESKADVTTMVNRTIYYEKSLTTDDTWLNNGIGIASDEGAGGQGDDGESDIQHMTKIRNDLKTFGYTTVNDLFDPGVSSNNVTTTINQGCGVMNYVGHGSNTYWVTSGFGVTQIKNLTNENKCPFIFDVACVNGNFKGKTCFAEGFTRATKNGNPTGALAIIASTINQSWSPPMDGQDEMVDILVDSYNNNIKQTFGGVAINGCMHMNDQYGSGGASMTNTWTIFGDPSVVIRNKAPKQATINHNHEVLIGDDAKFTLTSDIDNILVTLSRDYKIIATGLVKNGNVEFDLSSIKTEGDITITVTGQDIETYISQVLVAYNIYDVSFNITSAEDNNMIKDATILIDGKSLNTNGTDNTIIKLSKGSFNYSIKADGYVSQEGTINVVDKDIDVNINLEEVTYKIAFKVISSEDNNIIRGANITFKEKSIEYDGENNVVFDTKKGSFKYSIKADGYVSQEGTINVVDKDIDVNINLEEVTYKIAFNIVSAEDGSNIKGANITFKENSVEYDGENNVVFETKKGSFKYSIKADGYVSQEGTINVVDKDIDVNINLEEVTYKIAFKVISSKDNSNIKDAEINFNGTTIKHVGVNSSIFETKKGAFKYSIKADGYVSQEGTINVVDKDIDVNIKLEESTYQVAFKVISSEDNKIIKGANITFNEKSIEYDGENNVVFETKKGSFKYSIKADGYVSQEGTINLVDKDIDVNIKLEESTYKVAFKVISSEDNSIIKGANITFKENSVEYDGENDVVFETKKGSFKYSIKADGYVSQEGTINVIDKDIDVNINLEEVTYKVAFNIVSVEDGSNIKGANITFKENSVEYDGENDVVFETKKGSFKYSIKADGYVSQEGTINVIDKDIDVNINLEEVTYKVAFNIVSVEDGSNIKGANITFKENSVEYNGENKVVFETKKGSFKYCIKADGYVSQEGTINVIDKDIDVNINLEEVTYKIAFKVISSKDNSNIKDAEINFNGTTIKHDGVNSSIFETKKGTFQLSVKANGYEDYSKNIDVKNKDIELVIQMTPIVTAIENNNLNKVTIFPNPANERFTVTTDQNADYLIINSIGCLIKTGKLTDGDNIIECNNIPSGIYFVRIKNQHNTTTRRIVIK